MRWMQGLAAAASMLLVAGCNAAPQATSEPQEDVNGGDQHEDVDVDDPPASEVGVDDEVNGTGDGDAAETGDDLSAAEPETDEELLERGGEVLERNERSHVVLPDASPFQMHNEHGELMYSVEISDVHTDFSCQGNEAENAAGELIAIDFAITIEEEAELHQDRFFVDPHRFEVIDLDEQTVTDDPVSSASLSCLADSEQFPDAAEPVSSGESATGTIVLETPSDAGHLLLYHRAFDFTVEWTFDLT